MAWPIILWASARLHAWGMKARGQAGAAAAGARLPRSFFLCLAAALLLVIALSFASSLITMRAMGTSAAYYSSLARSGPLAPASTLQRRSLPPAPACVPLLVSAACMVLGPRAEGCGCDAVMLWRVADVML